MLSKPLYKRILVIDFETRWDRKDYTLSKMTTEQYIRDERFKAFGVCMKFLNDEEPAEWVPHDRIPDVLKTYNWNNTAVLAHNAQFDVAILSWSTGSSLVLFLTPCPWHVRCAASRWVTAWRSWLMSMGYRPRATRFIALMGCLS